MTNNTSSVGAACFLAGIAAGAAAAILFAPKAGSETREQISRGVADLKERGGNLLCEGKKRITNALESKREQMTA